MQHLATWTNRHVDGLTYLYAITWFIETELCLDWDWELKPNGDLTICETNRHLTLSVPERNLSITTTCTPKGLYRAFEAILAVTNQEDLQTIGDCYQRNWQLLRFEPNSVHFTIDGYQCLAANSTTAAVLALSKGWRKVSFLDAKETYLNWAMAQPNHE